MIVGYVLRAELSSHFLHRRGADRGGVDAAVERRSKAASSAQAIALHSDGRGRLDGSRFRAGAMPLVGPQPLFEKFDGGEKVLRPELSSHFLPNSRCRDFGVETSGLPNCCEFWRGFRSNSSHEDGSTWDREAEWMLRSNGAARPRPLRRLSPGIRMGEADWMAQDVEPVRCPW